MGWLVVHSPGMEDRGMSVIPFLHIAGADKVGAERGLCDTEEVKRAQERAEKGKQVFESSIFSKILLIKTYPKAQPEGFSNDIHTCPSQVEIHHSNGTLIIPHHSPDSSLLPTYLLSHQRAAFSGAGTFSRHLVSLNKHLRIVLSTS